MTVVVAYSNDVYGAAALDYGVGLAAEGGDRLVVVNATRGDKLVDDRYAGSAASEDVRARLEALPFEAELRQSISPDVADEVLAVAQEVQPRMLVVGVRHRTPLGKLIMGSVAQRLILEAHCPVVAVKPTR
ncbi:universal stress protein [Nocardioides sp. HDW12B]|uniref:universal stress protein n=1 Tax=Nocardioides sp. HDW12B TaxID=2714939 RepID=UPI001408D264|nr:universal stress protein [Nocardioides sp. HDW12B]QIK66162.1 universal stress protein [Nocardioides sp. HDW12B]